MSPTFSALGVRNYRIFALGGFVSNIGTWMGRVAQDWLVLTQLTDHSATALGVVTGLQFAGFPLLAPWSGLIADRFPKRRVLAVTQATMAASTGLLAVLALTGTAQLWMVYVIAAVSGAAAALDAPARQTFVSEMVPRESLSNAVGLSSASFNAARLVGPGLAGLIIAATSTGVALALNALSFAAVLVSLRLLRVRDLSPAPRVARGPGAIREGLRFVRARPDLILILGMVFVLGTFGMNYQMTTALMATMVFEKGPQEYGLLGSVMAIGSLSAALLSARRARPRLTVLAWSLSAFVVSSALAAAAPSYPLFAVALVPVGLSALTAMTTANAMVQLRVPPGMRGRVMALYMAVFMGGTPLGAPLIGWIGATFGARWTIAAGSLAVALSLVAALAVVLRTGWLSPAEVASRMRPVVPRPRRVVTAAGARAAGTPAAPGRSR